MARATAVASPEFCVRGHRFGFVKSPKIINVYHTTTGCILPSVRYRPVCHPHTIIKCSSLKITDTGYYKEAQLMLINPRDAFTVSQCYQTWYYSIGMASC